MVFCNARSNVMKSGPVKLFLPAWPSTPGAGSVKIPFRCGGFYDKVVSDIEV